MAFPKTWTEEQEKTLLEKYKSSKIEDLAKELNKTPKALRQKYSSISKKKKKISKKPIEKKETSSFIPVSQAPIKEEGEEMQQAYLEDTSFSENFSEETELNNLKEVKEENTSAPMSDSEEPSREEFVMDWEIFSQSITLMLDERFKSNGLTEMSEKEKEHFSRAMNIVLNNRAKLIGQYSDVIGLGIATFSIFSPRIMQFVGRKKKEKEKSNDPTAHIDLENSTTSVNQTPTKKEIVIDEKAEAEKRYLEMVETQHD